MLDSSIEVSASGLVEGTTVWVLPEAEAMAACNAASIKWNAARQKRAGTQAVLQEMMEEGFCKLKWESTVDGRTDTVTLKMPLGAVTTEAPTPEPQPEPDTAAGVATAATAPPPAPAAATGVPVTVEFPDHGPVGIHFDERASDDVQPIVVVKLAFGSPAASNKQLKIGMSLSAVQGESVLGLEYQTVLGKLRHLNRPLKLTLLPPTVISAATAGDVSNAAVVGSRLVSDGGFFARDYTVYLITNTTADKKVFTVEKRFSEIFDFHEQWTAPLMSTRCVLALPPKDLSYAQKNESETVQERSVGIQLYVLPTYDACGINRPF